MVRRRKKASAHVEEPELLPLLNIMFMLIIGVLSMSSFVPLGVITSESPKLKGGGAPSAARAAEAKRELNLTVFATNLGFDIQMFEQRVRGEGEVLIPKVASAAQSVYDFAALHRFLVRIKAAHPDESRIFFSLGPDVPYGDLIEIMDTARDVEPGDELPQSIKEQGRMFYDVAFLAGVVS